MAAIVVTTMGRNVNGNFTSLAAAATSGGDTFVNDGNTFLVLDNAAVAGTTVTFAIQTTIDGDTVAGKQVIVPASTVLLVGPFPTTNYNVTATGAVSVAYSSVTTLTVAAMRFSPNQ